MPDTAPEQGEIRVRLRQMLGRYDTRRDPARTAEDDQFGSVTDDEMFSLIDKELGAG
ncbi:MAG: hypothetical protein L0H64_06055 [Pseudonocardia sp.]|nr:hypothetical protein [Pseudonocardia sp.]